MAPRAFLVREGSAYLAAPTPPEPLLRGGTILDWFHIRNWRKFQHYKAASPAWIKLHCRDLMQNPESPLHELSDAELGQLVRLWIAATCYGGKIPHSVSTLRRLVGLKSLNSKLFIAKGLIFPEQSCMTLHNSEDSEEPCGNRPSESESESDNSEGEGDREPDSAERSEIALRCTDGLLPICEETIQEWSAIFPGVEVVTEVRRANAWMDANPKKRKTRRGGKRFLHAWMDRNQNNGSKAAKSSPVVDSLGRCLECGAFKCDSQDCKKALGVQG